MVDRERIMGFKQMLDPFPARLVIALLGLAVEVVRGWLANSSAGERWVRFGFPASASDTREVKNHDQNHVSLKNGGENDEIIFNDLTDDLKNKKSVSHFHSFNHLKQDHDRKEHGKAADETTSSTCDLNAERYFAETVKNLIQWVQLIDKNPPLEVLYG